MIGLLAQVADPGDPLFEKGVSFISTVFLIVVIKALVAFVVLLVGVMLMVWFERKVISDMQDRIGPNRAGPWGLLQTLADGTKLFFKENLYPEQADKAVFRLAPYLSAVPAFLTFCVIPVGGTVHWFGHTWNLQVADPPIGVLFSLAISGIAVYGIMLAGWSSGSKYPLLGSVRATAQMVSYEAAMGLAVATVVLKSGSLRTGTIVAQQIDERFVGRLSIGWLTGWNVIALGFIPAVIFAIAGTAELNRPPFDLVEAESELVGGFHTEYSSARFAFFYLAEFMNTITMSALIITLFLGGPIGPDTGIWGLHRLSPVWFLIKLLVLLFCYVWIRGTLPRFRYDQLMDLGWKKLIPAALFWLLIIATIRLNGDRTTRLMHVVIAIAAAGLGATVLRLAMRRGREQTDAEHAAAAAKTLRGAGSSSRPGRF